MAPRQPKTKEAVLDQIINDMLDTLQDSVGLFHIDQRKINEYLKKADTNKSGDFSSYHYIHALIHTIKCEYNLAEKKYKTALRLSSNNIPMLNNYATLLVDAGSYEEAFNIAQKLINDFRVTERITYNIIYNLMLRTLDVKYFDPFLENNDVMDYLKPVYALKSLKDGLSEISISIDEYRNFMAFLCDFIWKETRQNFRPRFTIVNDSEEYLLIEVFLDINSDEMLYLDSKFKEEYIDHIFDNNKYDSLGKFVVSFNQESSRHDNTKNPNDLYLGIKEGLMV